MCVKPIILKNQVSKATGKNKYTQPVPCGKCPECVKAKINSWLFRLSHELERSTNPLFVTLTYKDEKLYYQQKIETDFSTGEIIESLQKQPSLRKKDLQDFFKRLRKNQDKNYPDAPKIKYYACGEYGSRTHRPHYHIILLNVVDVDIIHDAWGNGHTLSLPLKAGGANYVLKYMSKQNRLTKKGGVKQPEFSLMSKELVRTTLQMQSIDTITMTQKTVLLGL